MASEINKQQLEQAYDLIQEDRHDDAVRFIRRVLENEAINSPQDNANAWWLMANAVEEPSDARRALINVLKYSPNHTMASQTLDELNDQFPPNDEELTMMLDLERTSDFDLADMSTALSDDELADLFSDDSDLDLSAFEDDAEDPFAELESLTHTEKAGKKAKKAKKAAANKRAEKERRSILAPVIVVLGAVIIASVLFLIASQNADSTADEGESDLPQLVAQSFDGSSSDITTLVNDIGSDAQQMIGADAASFVVDDAGAQTIFVQTCICIRRDCAGASSDQLFSMVEESFLTIAERAATQPVESVTQAGVDVKVCQSDDTVYRVTTAIENVIAYLNTNDINAFRSTWVVVEG